MGFFDFFNPWKKKFDDLVTNHRQAVLAFTKNRYSVYKDMRQDHKNLFSEYCNLWDNEISAIVGKGDIDSLSKDAKKYLVKNKEYILRLHKTYKKYSTKKERVRNLASRFAVGDIFRQTAVSLLGTSDINIMTEEYFDVILANYNKLIEKATDLKQRKMQRQQEVKEKLAKKIQVRRNKLREELERRVKEQKVEEERIKRERREEEERLMRKIEQERVEQERTKIKIEVERVKNEQRTPNIVCGEIESSLNIYADIFPYEFGSFVTDGDKLDIKRIYSEYKYHGIFNRVIRSKIPSLVNNKTIIPSEVKRIKSLKKDFEREADFFNKIKEVPERKQKYKKLIRNKGFKDQHEGIMYCLHNLRELDALEISSTVPIQSSVIPQRAPKKNTSSSEFELRKRNQDNATEILNKNIKLFPKLSLYPTKMYVNAISNSEKVKKIITFPHVIFYEMGHTNLGNLSRVRDACLYVVRSCKRFVPIVLPEYRMLVNYLANDFNPKEVLFIMETSASQKSTELNKNNLNEIYLDLKNKGYNNWGYLGNEDKIFKCIIVLEVSSEVVQFKKVAKKISMKYPDSAIIYLSIYGELTDIQIRNKFGKKQ